MNPKLLLPATVLLATTPPVAKAGTVTALPGPVIVAEQEPWYRLATSQAQGFYSVTRPKKAPDWSLRFTLEMPL